VDLQKVSPGEVEGKYKQDVASRKAVMCDGRVMKSEVKQVEEEFTKNLQEKLQDVG